LGGFAVGHFKSLLLEAVAEGDEDAGRLWAPFCRPAPAPRSLLALCRSARAAGACWWQRPRAGAAFVPWARSRFSSAFSARPVFVGSGRLVGGSPAELVFCFGSDIAAAGRWAAIVGGRGVVWGGLAWVAVVR